MVVYFMKVLAPSHLLNVVAQMQNPSKAMKTFDGWKKRQIRRSHLWKILTGERKDKYVNVIYWTWSVDVIFIELVAQNPMKKSREIFV